MSYAANNIQTLYPNFWAETNNNSRPLTSKNLRRESSRYLSKVSSTVCHDRSNQSLQKKIRPITVDSRNRKVKEPRGKFNTLNQVQESGEATLKSRPITANVISNNGLLEMTKDHKRLIKSQSDSTLLISNTCKPTQCSEPCSKPTKLGALVLNARPTTRSRRKSTRECKNNLWSGVISKSFSSCGLKTPLRLNISENPISGEGGAANEVMLPNLFLTSIESEESVLTIHEDIQLMNDIINGSKSLYQSNNIQEAVSHFEAVLKVSLSQKVHNLAALMYHQIGTACKEARDFEYSIKMQMNCIKYAKLADDQLLEARGYKGLGVLYLNMKDFRNAMEYQNRALAIALREKDLELESRAYANLGNIYKAQNNFNKAKIYYNKDLDLSIQIDSWTGILRALRNFSLVSSKIESRKKWIFVKKAISAQIDDDDKAFLHDLQYHSNDAVGNIYLQMSNPDEKISKILAEAIDGLFI